ncbi:hypothetical protein DYQ86_04270 [Acidobacteria bacterium AB60]|nr:hypothetical protein DYQ86_04270 [Acidobacteria bacterium AB60]
MKHVYGVILLAMAAAMVVPAQSISINVNCNNGQSLNRVLSRLERQVAVTVTVTGTCSEFVQVAGFDNLTLRGAAGASITQPAATANTLPVAVLAIGASRSVTVSGLAIQATGTAGPSAIGIGHGSSDIRLMNLQATGGSAGIVVYENSQVLLSHVTVQNSGYASFALFDSSDAHVEHCLFEDTTGTTWHTGIFAGAAHVTMFDDTIRDFQVGIFAGSGAIVDTVAYTTYTPSGGPTDVVIDGPAGNTYNGVQLSAGASLNLSSRLVINGVGQTWGGTTGGILVSDGAALSAANGSLAITGSYGQGVLVENNAHATLTGASITGSGHGGVVAVNGANVAVAPGGSLTLVGGNAVDLFCDASSRIVGGANLAGVPTLQCANLAASVATLP